MKNPPTGGGNLRSCKVPSERTCGRHGNRIPTRPVAGFLFPAHQAHHFLPLHAKPFIDRRWYMTESSKDRKNETESSLFSRDTQPHNHNDQRNTTVHEVGNSIILLSTSSVDNSKLQCHLPIPTWFQEQS